MLKKGVASDLHLDFGDINPEFLEWRGDVLFLAGDIAEDDRSRSESLRPFWDGVAQMAPEVYMVCGNHEHYGSELDATHDHLSEFFARNYPSIMLLENDVATLSDGTKVFGSTYWTDFGGNPMAELEVSTSLNDYRQVRLKRAGYRRINANDIKMANHRAKNALLDAIEQHENLIVMTHHAPSWDSIVPKYNTPENFLINHGYANRLDSLIESCENISTWLHGHTHHSSDYLIGKTRVIANPRGYPRERVEWYTQTYLPFEF